jgi:hypothetical protein
MQQDSRSNVAPRDSRWQMLLGSIRAIQMELKRRQPQRPIGLSGNPAAPESAILVTELRLGRKLPPSYREFLAFSDGWTTFFNGASLLGTSEIGRLPGETRSLRRVSPNVDESPNARCPIGPGSTCPSPAQRGRGEPGTNLGHEGLGTRDAAHERLLAHGRLLPFGVDRAGASLFAFDTSVRLADGELGVVAWVGGLGIDCRCFTSFLATVLQLCRVELSTAKASDPRSSADAASTSRSWLDVG